MKYALGLDPKRPASQAGIPGMEMIKGSPHLSYWKSTTAENVVLLLEATTNLKNWTLIHPGNPSGEPIDDRVRVKAHPTIASEPRAFFRLRAERTD
ncbi:MAG TPA: hypothetical protein VK041_04400 [Opitutales bacterium]|nr:hypothetical protein [Opitutales bacterium]